MSPWKKFFQMLRAKQQEDNDFEKQLWQEELSESIGTAFRFYDGRNDHYWAVQKAGIIDEWEDDCRVHQSNLTIYYRNGLNKMFSLIKTTIGKEMIVVELKVGHLSALVLAFVGELTDSDNA